jgi:hypothetical protein
MTDALPPTAKAKAEIERTIEERQVAIRDKNPPGAIDRLNAMREALELVRICEAITYFETPGYPPTKPT